MAGVSAHSIIFFFGRTMAEWRSTRSQRPWSRCHLSSRSQNYRLQVGLGWLVEWLWFPCFWQTPQADWNWSTPASELGWPTRKCMRWKYFLFSSCVDYKMKPFFCWKCSKKNTLSQAPPFIKNIGQIHSGSTLKNKSDNLYLFALSMYNSKVARSSCWRAIDNEVEYPQSAAV